MRKAGLSVVGLERGDRRGVEDFQDIHDEWRYAVNYGLMQDLSKETITFRNTEEMRALPMRKLGSFLARRRPRRCGRALERHEFPFLAL